MLIRAIRLRGPIDEYYKTEEAKVFALSADEWKQVEYLVDLIKPFNFFTHLIGMLRGPIVRYIYKVYNALFTYIKGSLAKLQAKHQNNGYPWINPMVIALDDALLVL